MKLQQIKGLLLLFCILVLCQIVLYIDYVNAKYSDNFLHNCKKKDADDQSEEVYADILTNIKDDTIELWYACIGYTLDSNKPIYSYEMLIDLLINYGYTISYILYALDKLAVEDLYDDGSGLLIMNCAQRNMIYSDIEPLDNDVVKQLQKQFVPGRC